MPSFTLSIKLNISTERDKNRPMTDWVQDAKKRIHSTRERAQLNRHTLQTQVSRVWDKFMRFTVEIVNEFNEGERFVEYLPGNGTDFSVHAVSAQKHVTVSIDHKQGFIAYKYRGVRDAEPGKFYLEANPEGSVLLICIGTPCDKSIETEEAVQIVLQPLFNAVA
jgi:hypothetical protein